MRNIQTNWMAMTHEVQQRQAKELSGNSIEEDKLSLSLTIGNLETNLVPSENKM
jgi:hypothetical protein